jgi:hypothetical protein
VARNQTPDTLANQGAGYHSATPKGIPVDQQTKYRSGVGMLLYLVKHTRFDIVNSVRELSKLADGAPIAHWELLQRCIKYFITTENLALKVKPNNLEGMTELEGISGV